jgi:hypothetical protein
MPAITAAMKAAVRTARGFAGRKDTPTSVQQSVFDKLRAARIFLLPGGTQYLSYRSVSDYPMVALCQSP